ncbi:MAG: LemA family protein, partial [Bacteroidia bacterium]|nr:LemA family protein [Bacteroidia bacterium]
AQGQLGQALGRLLMVTENYPELRSNAAFSELRTSIEGCENRIATARTVYNDKVTNFNTEISKIPGSLFAWGYKDLPTFKSDAGAEKAPKIDFSTPAK